MDEKLILASVDHKWCTNGRLVRDEDGREFPPPPPHRRLQTCQTAHSRHEEARLPVRNLLVHFPARGRRYPSSREGPREVSAREVRASGRRQDAHASSSRSLVPPTHAHARKIDRPRREKRGGNITLVTRIYTMNTFELKAETKAPPQRFDSFNGLRRSGSGAIVSGAPREIPVRSTFARGDESTPTAICLPPSRKKGSGKPTSAFSARSTRL